MYARIVTCAKYRTVVRHGSCTTRRREGAERAPPTFPSLPFLPRGVPVPNSAAKPYVLSLGAAAELQFRSGERLRGSLENQGKTFVSALCPLPGLYRGLAGGRSSPNADPRGESAGGGRYTEGRRGVWKGCVVPSMR